MGRKIATVILMHDCDENPCHLDNESQIKWIRQNLPISKLEWNWKLFAVKVYDVGGSEEQGRVDAVLGAVKAKLEGEGDKSK
ncbi:MAG: hypothetical protein HYU39_01710 [Thaumarchaeota archaeon]|nr:hypothetical protein [Nitrososphaerota archaeon]